MTNFLQTLYDIVSVTGTDAVVARNTTINSMPTCVTKPYSRKDWSLYVQTKFSNVAIGPDFKLEQKARLRFGEDKLCTLINECDELDIDQKFPACHGVPNGDPNDHGKTSL